MKISGFSLIRNGVRFDYPFLESYRSILPLVDELVINVGDSDDGTLMVLDRFSKEEGSGKIKLIQSVWPMDNLEKRKSGLILSEQTNIALEACNGDWLFYLQSDEVLHENDLSSIRHRMDALGSRSEIEAMVFEYHHFYGSYDVVQETRSAYRREVRAFKRSSGARSVGDAQSFRKLDGSKLRAALVNASVYHYGWVRTPDAMREKTFFMDQLYHGAPTGDLPHTGRNYRYKRFWGLRRFQGSHPAVMAERIRKKNWSWDLQASPWVWSWRDGKKVILDTVERITGIRLFEYRSYRLVR